MGYSPERPPHGRAGAQGGESNRESNATRCGSNGYGLVRRRGRRVLGAGRHQWGRVIIGPGVWNEGAVAGRADQPIDLHGQHCFGSAVDVAAAAARIAADTERQVRMIVDARRIADAGGPLPPIGYDTIFVVSDPDANNCVQVTASVYNPPPAR